MFSIPAAPGVGLQALLATPSYLPPNGIVPRISTVAIGTLVPLYFSLRLLAQRPAASTEEEPAELRGWLRYWTGKLVVCAPLDCSLFIRQRVGGWCHASFRRFARVCFLLLLFFPLVSLADSAAASCSRACRAAETQFRSGELAGLPFTVGVVLCSSKSSLPLSNLETWSTITQLISLVGAAFGSFKVLEVFSDKLVFWIPYYVQLKWLSLLWLQMPVRRSVCCEWPPSPVCSSRLPSIT